MNEPKLGPTWTDLAFQVGYVGAYQVLRTYWRLRHPTTHGALVMLWCEGEVLLVRQSYVPYYSAPGGYLHVGEGAVEAAQRELLEEIGISAPLADFRPALETTHDWEGKRDHVTIFSLELAQRPRVQPDYREVVETFWFKPEQVRGLTVFPPLKQAIAQHADGAK